MAISLVGSWYARRGRINPDEVSKVKGSDVEREKPILDLLRCLNENLYQNIVTDLTSLCLCRLREDHRDHHHLAPSAWISLTLSCHSYLSSIASGRSSGYIPYRYRAVCMQVLAGRPAFARLCEVVHRSMSLMSSSLLLQQCPACLVRLTWIVFVMGVRWPYSCCFVGCCLKDLFNIARSILV